MVKVPVPSASDAGNRPTVLLVGRGEPMDAALRLALDRHTLAVEEASGDVRTAVLTAAPDLVLLVGDASRDGGRKILDQLSADATVAAIPVAVLSAGGKLDSRVAAYRHGAVAVIPRTASADAIATRVALLVKEIQERAAAPQPELGEATFDELVDLVSRELRSGILSVQSKDGEPVRLVLGAGRPVAAAVEEFVRRLRPLVARAEPLNYELHVSSGGQVGMLDAEPGPEVEAAPLEGLRVLLVDTDPARADALAQELRARKVVVSVADASGRGLERAKGLDPEIVIVDAAGIEGPGFDVLRAIRRDLRLRWASMLVAPWDEIWPDPESIPDVARLAERITPLVVHDRQLAHRAKTETAFDTRLEATGPCRLLRILTAAGEPVHVTVRSRTGSIEVDVAEGLVVGAQGNSSGQIVEGIAALATMLAMGSARVHVERRANPTTANLMAPVEEALARATEEAKPLPLSQPPPAPQASGGGVRKRPFPAAAELREAAGVGPRTDPRAEPDASMPRRPPMAARLSPPTSASTSKGMSWTDSEEAPKLAPPREAAKAAFAALFQETESLATAPEESTKLYDSNELARIAATPAEGDATDVEIATPAAPVPRAGAKPLVAPPTGVLTGGAPTPAHGALRAPALGAATHEDAAHEDAAHGDATHGDATHGAPTHGAPAHGAAPVAPRKKTLMMGGPLLKAPPIPRPVPDLKARGEPVNRNPTLTMGSAPPGPRTEATKGSALSAFGPITKLSRTSSSPPAAPKTDERDSIEELVSGAMSLPPDEGAAPLASVSEAPEPRTSPGGPSLVDLVPSEPPMAVRSGELMPVEPRESGEIEDKTVTSGTPFNAPPLPPHPPEPPRRDIGNLQTLPAGAPAIAVAPPAVPPAPPVPAPPPALPPSPPPSGWPTPPPADTVRTAPVAPPNRGARAIAWVLVALGSLVLVGVGVLLVWSKVLGNPLPWEASARVVPPPPILDAGASTPSVDAGAAAVAVLDAGGPMLDAGLAAAPIDAGADAGVDAGVDGGVDAPAVVEAPETPETPEVPEVAPGDDPAAAATALVERAEDATDPVAETLYRQALALDPRNHYAMLGLAEILMRRGQPAEAIPLIEGAIARRRNRAAYRVLLGDARRDAGDAAGARRAWEEALEIDPENRQAHDRLGH